MRRGTYLGGDELFGGKNECLGRKRYGGVFSLGGNFIGKLSLNNQEHTCDKFYQSDTL